MRTNTDGLVRQAPRKPVPAGQLEALTRGFPEPSAFEVGSQPPAGYVAWHEWAAAQGRGGLRQKQCKVCKLWRFPQEECDHSADTKEQR